MRVNRSIIRNGILAFWAVWFSIVFASNACDGLKALRVLPADWQFASGNLEFVRQSIARYSLSQFVPNFLFLGVVIWEGLASALFCCATLLVVRKSNEADRAVQLAFAVGLALWAAFVLADEILIQYAVEGTHVRLFVAQLASLMYLELVPDR